MARLIGHTMDTLKGMRSNDPRLPDLVHSLTENFDKFPDVKLDGVAGAGGDAAGSADSGKKPVRGGKSGSNFVGYTFKRPKDGGAPVLTGGAPHTSRDLLAAKKASMAASGAAASTAATE